MFDSWDDVKEFSWFFAQLMVVSAVIIGVLGIGLFIIVTLIGAIFPYTPASPPTMNAPLLEIVRYCEPLARDEHKYFNGKTYMKTYTDNPDKFVACMQGYEYTVKR